MPPVRMLLFPWAEVLRALFRPFYARKDMPIHRIFVPLALVMVAVWFVTVPVHELLHAAGCLLSGGRVTELTIQPMYGGTVLSRIFDFVTPGGSYAGQLKGFDTGGRDLCYFMTVGFPFLLTVCFGIPLLAIAARAGNPLWHGIGAIQTLLPFASITGDYYEMGSIMTTRLFGFMPGTNGANLFRGDDLFLVISRVREAAPENGALVILLGVLLGIVFIGVTVDLSLLLAAVVARKRLEKGRAER